MGILRSLVKQTAYKAITVVGGDPGGFVVMPILAGPAKGLRLKLDLVKRREALFWGNYERQILDRLDKIVKPGWTVWDCGTHIGYYSCYFARAVGSNGHVVVVEPDIRNLNRTKENIERNNMKNFTVQNTAVGRPGGMIEFCISDNSNSHIPGLYVGGPSQKAEWASKEASLQKVMVDCAGLDELYFERGLPKPDLIKLDIEGAEIEALQHVDRLVREVRPLIVLELHNPECDAAAWKFAVKTGCTLQSLDSGQMVTQAKDVNGTLLCRFK